MKQRWVLYPERSLTQACHLGGLIEDQPHDAEIYEVRIDLNPLENCDRQNILVLKDHVEMDQVDYPHSKSASGPTKDAQDLDEDEKSIKV